MAGTHNTELTSTTRVRGISAKNIHGSSEGNCCGTPVNPDGDLTVEEKAKCVIQEQSGHNIKESAELIVARSHQVQEPTKLGDAKIIT